MTTEKLNLDLALRNAQDFDRLAKNLQKSLQSTDKMVTSISKFGKEIERVVNQTSKLQVSLAEVSKGMGVGQLGQMMARGNPLNFLKNQNTKGMLSDFNASLEQTFASITNRYARGINDVIRAANNSTLVNLAKTRQNTPGSTLGEVEAQIKAQTFRIVQFEQQAATMSGAVRNNKIKQIEKERIALENLTQTYKKLEVAEKLQAQAASRQNKVDAITGDGGASLFKIQAALLVNYALMGQIFNLFRFGTRYVVEYDKALRDLQAVTDTTNTEMQGLSKTFLEVSNNTKFSAVELAQAGVTLGQAGLSAKQINESIASVAMLATASNSDLATSVDVVTSALTVFNMNASETEHVANVMTASLNLTKLSMDKLQLGIQYAGNAAAEAGITLEELVASLGAMSNAGIKSGSTLGTGLTQVIVELQSPSKKLYKELQTVGLTLADVDIKAKGLTTVLETMRAAGFSSANAFQSMDLRAARAYLALSRNTETARELEVALQLSTAATKANDIQMQSLANSGMKLRNNLGEFLINVAEPFKQAMIAVTNLMSSLLQIINEYPTALRLFGTLLLSALAGTVITKVALLVSNLGNLKTMLATTIPVLSLFTRTLMGAGTAATAAEVATGRLGKAFTFLASTGIGRVATAITLVVAAIMGYNAITGRAADETDKLQASMDKAKGEFDSTAQTMESVDSEITRLVNRYNELNGNSKALTTEVIAMQSKFGEFTADLKMDTIKTVDDLIVVLRNLRGEMANVAREQLALMALSESNLFMRESANANKEFSSTWWSRNVPKLSGPSVAVRDDFAKTAGNFSGKDIAFMDREELGNAQAVFQRQWESLNSESIRLQKINNEIQSKINFANQGIVKVSDDELKSLQVRYERNEAQLELNGKAATTARQLQVRIINQLQVRSTQISAEISGSKQVEKLNDEVIKARVQLSNAKDSGSAAQVKEAEKAIKATEAKINASVKEIAASTGHSVVDVQAVIDDTLITSLNEATSDASVAYRNMTRELGAANASYLSKITEMQKLSIEEIKRQIDQATQDAENRIGALNAVIGQITDHERGGLRGLYSDAEVSMFQDQANNIETGRIGERIAMIQALQPKLDQLVEQQRQVYERAQAASNADPKDGAKLQAAIQTQKDYNAAIDETIKYKNEVNVLTAEYNARLGIEAEAHMTLGEQIEYVIERYNEQISLQNDLGLNIQKNLIDVMDNARTSFGSFVKDWVSGTKSAGDAFRSFAQGVIEQMLEMAAQQVANQAMGGLFSLFGSAASSLFGGSVYSSPIGPTMTPNAGGFFGMKQGGFVRAATGYGVPGRDSVPIMAMPGEYVLRKSAVDTIGRGNLDAINAAGNTNISRSARNVSGIAPTGGDSEGSTVNVWIVPPDAQPPMGKRDVLAVVQQDIVQRGSTAKLIKQVVTGG